MKYCVIIADGMADYPNARLDGKTPVEAARTPNMDRVSREGQLGLCQTVPRGLAPGSDVAIMSVMGYPPKEFYTGRAPLEAASMGIELDPEDVAVRCNFVTAGGETMEDFAAGHISSDEASVLIGALNEALGDECSRFYAGVGYRHILVLSGRPDFKVKTVPPHDIIGKPMVKYLPRGQGAEILLKLMERSAEVLEKNDINAVRLDLGQNPANMIWLWGEGRKPELELFKKRFGVDGAVISAVNLVQGMAKLTGMEVIEVPGATGYTDTDYAAKARYALDALRGVDLVIIHVEAPDEASHEGDLAQKIRAIEHIDREIVAPVVAELAIADESRVLVMPDHYTPVTERTHTREPVPFALWGSGIKEVSGLDFTEKNAASTRLKIRRGHTLMERLIKGK